MTCSYSVTLCVQVTCFVALLYLDAKRQLTNRLDVVCCIRVKEEHRFDKEEGSHGYLYRFFRDYYSHFIMNDVVRAIVVRSMCMHQIKNNE